MIAVLVVVSALDLATFLLAVSLRPDLVAYELGPIRTVYLSLGALGAVAWKCAGLAVLLASLAVAAQRHRSAVRALGTVALAAAAIGAVGNVWALL